MTDIDLRVLISAAAGAIRLGSVEPVDRLRHAAG